MAFKGYLANVLNSSSASNDPGAEDLASSFRWIRENKKKEVHSQRAECCGFRADPQEIVKIAVAGNNGPCASLLQREREYASRNCNRC